MTNRTNKTVTLNREDFNRSIDAAYRAGFAAGVLGAVDIAEIDCRSDIAIKYDYKPDWYIHAHRIAAAIRTLLEN